MLHQVGVSFDLVKSLFKKGKRGNCSNYKAISLLNSAYRIHGKIAAQRFKTISSPVRSQLVSLEFFIDIKSFRSHYGPGVDSASNINEYQEHFLEVKVAGA